ncbi:hypothetical protein BaRGS_00016173 [Batillaria attramentaria]|uniref:Uncharacterized protein n=1 Tax=Batillaria attramentaria TaxID=370345 RepID=A0ABD0L0E6_9CAEN
MSANDGVHTPDKGVRLRERGRNDCTCPGGHLPNDPQHHCVSHGEGIPVDSRVTTSGWFLLLGHVLEGNSFEDICTK